MNEQLFYFLRDSGQVFQSVCPDRLDQWTLSEPEDGTDPPGANEESLDPLTLRARTYMKTHAKIEGFDLFFFREHTMTLEKAVDDLSKKLTVYQWFNPFKGHMELPKR